MTERDLDRLVSKTQTSPICLQTLRYVRTAISDGTVSEPRLYEKTWAVQITRRNGLSVTFTFPLKES